MFKKALLLPIIIASCGKDPVKAGVSKFLNDATDSISLFAKLETWDVNPGDLDADEIYGGYLEIRRRAAKEEITIQLDTCPPDRFCKLQGPAFMVDSFKASVDACGVVTYRGNAEGDSHYFFTSSHRQKTEIVIHDWSQATCKIKTFSTQVNVRYQVLNEDGTRRETFNWKLASRKALTGQRSQTPPPMEIQPQFD